MQNIYTGFQVAPKLFVFFMERTLAEIYCLRYITARENLSYFLVGFL